MKRATPLFVFILVIAGALVGVVLSNVLASSESPIMIFGFFGLCVIFLLGFFAWAIWKIVSSSGKIKVADSRLRRDVIKFEPNPNLATLYISRPQIIGFAVAFPVIINEVNTLWTKGKTFYRLDLPAGTYTLTGDKKCKQNLSVNLNVGEITYVEQEVLMGMMSGGYGFKKMDNIAEAQKGITLCKLLQSPEIK